MNKFTPLYPNSFNIDTENEYKIYKEVFTEAINDNKVKNLAITGAYGSGKSSIIEKLIDEVCKDNNCRCNKDNYIEISLATFESKDNWKNKTQVELSILKQLLYKVNQSKLPLSRFKRIDSRLNKIVSFVILILILIFIYNSDSNFILKAIALINSFNIIINVILNILVLSITYYLIYLGLSNLNLSSLKINSIEFDLDTKNNESILDKNLEEIIYFFQKTSYEIVIFEDLDRFKDLSIFTNLREINKIINANENIKNKVTFIYAITDELFKVAEDRTKFFDIIIPVIPSVIKLNSYNVLKDTYIQASFKYIVLCFLYQQHFFILINLHNIKEDTNS